MTTKEENKLIALAMHYAGRGPGDSNRRRLARAVIELSEENARLLDRLSLAEEALRFYANEDNYDEWHSLTGVRDPATGEVESVIEPRAILVDEGRRASAYFSDHSVKGQADDAD